MRVRPDKVWFLYDDELFMERKLELAVCPKCDKLLARLTERRKTDSKYFEAAYSEEMAKRAIEDLRGDIAFTSDDLTTKKSLYGWVYGENKEKVNKKTGETESVQKACDFFGTKKTIKTIKNNKS